MKRKSIVLGSVLACMSIASQASAQQFPADDLVVTDTVLVLPAKQAQAAGFPQWREVRMTGPNGVPYRYCNWLIGAERWMEPIFGPNRWVAVKNCADGITAVTRRELQANLPYGEAVVKRYWETRPQGFSYMVPDRISQSTFEALMEVPLVEVEGFVFEPEQVYDDLAALERRMQALEKFNQRLLAEGGVVTKNSLRATLEAGGFVQESDLPDTSSFVPKTGVQTMIDTAMPDVSSFVPKVEVQQMIDSATPDTSRFLTREQADDLYQPKDPVIPPPVTGWSLWNWLWVVLLLVTLLLLGWWLWSRKKSAADEESKQESVSASDISSLNQRLDSQADAVADADKKADQALQRIDEVRGGLEALIAIEAHDRLNAPGFTNEALANLGDEPFVLTMPGIGVARKKIHIFNRGDHVELLGLQKGHDRVDKIDVVAVLKHIAKARLPENQWITGLTAQRVA